MIYISYFRISITKTQESKNDILVVLVFDSNYLPLIIFLRAQCTSSPTEYCCLCVALRMSEKELRTIRSLIINNINTTSNSRHSRPRH